MSVSTTRGTAPRPCAVPKQREADEGRAFVHALLPVRMEATHRRGVINQARITQLGMDRAVARGAERVGRRDLLLTRRRKLTHCAPLVWPARPSMSPWTLQAQKAL
jgi:hypothetical protein